MSNNTDVGGGGSKNFIILRFTRCSRRVLVAILAYNYKTMLYMDMKHLTRRITIALCVILLCPCSSFAALPDDINQPEETRDSLWYRPYLTISNNLVYDAALTPNLRFAYTADSSHWEYGVTVGFNPWPRGNLTKKKLRNLVIAPELRYWCDTLKLGHFFGADAIYSHFNAGYTDLLIYKGVKDERRQGDLVALGAFYGYRWRLGRRWTVEALAGVAVGYAWYDRFVLDEHCDCWTPIGDGGSVFLLPQLGLTITYHIPLTKKENKNNNE